VTDTHNDNDRIQWETEDTRTLQNYYLPKPCFTPMKVPQIDGQYHHNLRICSCPLEHEITRRSQLLPLERVEQIRRIEQQDFNNLLPTLQALGFEIDEAVLPGEKMDAPDRTDLFGPEERGFD